MKERNPSCPSCNSKRKPVCPARYSRPKPLGSRRVKRVDDDEDQKLHVKEVRVKSYPRQEKTNMYK